MGGSRSKLADAGGGERGTLEGQGGGEQGRRPMGRRSDSNVHTGGVAYRATEKSGKLEECGHNCMRFAIQTTGAHYNEQGIWSFARYFMTLDRREYKTW